MVRYFGTNGVRGTFDVLDPMLAMRLAASVGVYFNRGTILVARDARLTGECLEHAVFAGLQSVGCQPVSLGIVSSPTAEFMVKKLSADGLIIITASHNPPEWNALKVVDKNGVTISWERGEEIERIMESKNRTESGTTSVTSANWDSVKDVRVYPSAEDEHIAEIKKSVDQKLINPKSIPPKLVQKQTKKFKVVLDCGSGTAATIAPRLFRELGCDVTILNGTVDGRFPGRPSEPREENIQELLRLVPKLGADIGIAWDGDGDRVVCVDEKGGFVVGDRVFALCALSELRNQKGNGAIATTVATSKAVEEVAARFGCKTIYTKIGAPYLSEAVAMGGAGGSTMPDAVVMAGEEVGGVIWPKFSLAKDGFLTAAKIIEFMCEKGKSLSELLKDVPLYFNEKEKIPCTAEQKEKIVSGMRKYVRDNKLIGVLIDGVRINFEDGFGSWVICRASGTENYVRVFAESKDKIKARKLVEEYKGIANKYMSE